MQAFYGAGVAFIAVTLVISAMRYFANLRTRRLTATLSPAIVLSSGMSPNLRKVLGTDPEFFRYDVNSTIMLTYFSVTADAAEIGLWSTTREPFARVPWSAVDRVVVASIQEPSTTSNGIEVAIRTPKGQVVLSLIIIGRGLMGMFSEHFDVLDGVVARMDSLRIAGDDGSYGESHEPTTSNRGQGRGAVGLTLTGSCGFAAGIGGNISGSIGSYGPAPFSTSVGPDLGLGADCTAMIGAGW